MTPASVCSLWQSNETGDRKSCCRPCYLLGDEHHFWEGVLSQTEICWMFFLPRLFPSKASQSLGLGLMSSTGDKWQVSFISCPFFKEGEQWSLHPNGLRLRAGVEPKPMYLVQADPAARKSLPVSLLYVWRSSTFPLTFMMLSAVFISDIYILHSLCMACWASCMRNTKHIQCAHNTDTTHYLTWF